MRPAAFVPSFAFLIVLAMAQSAEAQRCQSRFMDGTGVWSAGDPRFTARLAWTWRTKSLYGERWSNWSRAASKRYDCQTSGRRQRCTAVARPCLDAGPGRPRARAA
jgi:hypothetical protein